MLGGGFILSEANAANTCMGKAVDFVGTSKADIIGPSWEDDKNGDGWLVYAGGKGNDTFYNDLDGGSPDHVIACGYAGNDVFTGGWTKVDGGSGTDTARLATCWFEHNAQNLLKMESVGLYDGYCEDVP